LRFPERLINLRSYTLRTGSGAATVTWNPPITEQEAAETRFIQAKSNTPSEPVERNDLSIRATQFRDDAGAERLETTTPMNWYTTVSQVKQQTTTSASRHPRRKTVRNIATTEKQLFDERGTWKLGRWTEVGSPFLESSTRPRGEHNSGDADTSLLTMFRGLEQRAVVEDNWSRLRDNSQGRARPENSAPAIGRYRARPTVVRRAEVDVYKTPSTRPWTAAANATGTRPRLAPTR